MMFYRTLRNVELRIKLGHFIMEKIKPVEFWHLVAIQTCKSYNTTINMCETENSIGECKGRDCPILMNKFNLKKRNTKKKNNKPLLQFFRVEL